MDGTLFAQASPSTPLSRRNQEKSMGKYIVGWFLGVPVVVLVLLYFVFH
jgi:hypothetical protein